MSNPTPSVKRDSSTKLQKQEQFLAWFDKLSTLAAAAEAANISRTAVYHWLKGDQKFRARYYWAVKTSRLLAQEEIIEQSLNNAIQKVVPHMLGTSDPSGFSDKLLLKIFNIRRKNELERQRWKAEILPSVIQAMRKIKEEQLVFEKNLTAKTNF